MCYNTFFCSEGDDLQQINLLYITNQEITNFTQRDTMSKKKKIEKSVQEALKSMDIAVLKETLNELFERYKKEQKKIDRVLKLSDKVDKSIYNSHNQLSSKNIELQEDLVDKSKKLRKSYKALLKKNKLLEEYKNAINLGTIVSKTDLSGNITYVNSRFCDISGYNEKELIGKPHNIVRHPNMPASAFQELWETIQQKKVWKGLVQNRKKDATSYFVESVVVPILDENEVITEYISIRTDVTELIEKEKELESYRIDQLSCSIDKALELNHQHIVDAIAMPALMVDKSDTVLACNDAFISLFDEHPAYAEHLYNVTDSSLSEYISLEELNMFDGLMDWKEDISDVYETHLNTNETKVRIKLGKYPEEEVYLLLVELF